MHLSSVVFSPDFELIKNRVFLYTNTLTIFILPIQNKQKKVQVV